jgi:hypothetical protein
MTDHSNHSCLVIDNGLFCELPGKLAESFGKVWYFTPWAGAFPTTNQNIIGKDLGNFERIDDFWPIIRQADLVVFPDIYWKGLEVHLAEDLGKRVWGSRYGEDLETERTACKEFLKAMGLLVGPYRVLTGIANLRDYLKTHENQYVKISKTRGDMESFHSASYRNIEPRLDELEHRLGAKKAIMEFVVEEAIPDAVEVGYDGYCVDGTFPNQACVGIEIKSKGYVGHFLSRERMPEQITEINRTLAPALQRFKYRNFFAAETRITKDQKSFVIDPCCRFGSPPSEMLLELYTNLADILWHGAEGECIDPEPSGEWGAEIILYSDWAEKNWMAVDFPEDIRQYVKLRNATKIDGRFYVMPQQGGSTHIGAVVATASTLKEAREICCERAAKVEGYGLESHPTCLSEAEEEIAKLKTYGVTL